MLAIRNIKRIHVYLPTCCPTDLIPANLSVNPYRSMYIQYYMSLNATKRPFGHFDVSVLKLGNSEKIMLYAFFFF